MPVARRTAFALGLQILGTACLLLDSIRTAVRGVRLGDPAIFTSTIFQWANVVGFAFLFGGFVLQGLALWQAWSAPSTNEVVDPTSLVAVTETNRCDAERAATMRAEYDAVCKLVGPTSTLRFTTLVAYFALNGLLLNPVLQSEEAAIPRWWVVIGILANFAFGLLELRTRDAHRRLMERGAILEDGTHLAIPDRGIFTQERDRGPLPGHGKILIWMYFITAVLWLLLSLAGVRVPGLSY
jgi:hypothetical protein